ncbi:membrane protein insertase YidC [Pseudazoarcus pumilus]|uniref:Membrane protein insertase YidC n=1 Tax=Pseudazoarcus pumilus TaxID=2067960 RepID=A0A2I6SAI6_9RHOO|nr:membrane protein insertase YidC [Pseudazoarcus pumilus]AUN96271.1 membrane protein insertase YidC [Pseudazoarcus pumilus]
MDHRRLIALLILSFSIVMLWDAWVSEQQAQQPASAPTAAVQSGVPSASSDGSVPTPSAALSDASGADELPQASETAPEAPDAARMTVRTDMVEAEISARGGQIVKLRLLHHDATNDRDQPFVLFDDGVTHRYFAQSGLIGEGMPSHHAVHRLPAEQVSLEAGQDELVLRLPAEVEGDLAVTKVMTFRRGSYVVEVGYELENRSQAPLSTHAYFQFSRDGQPAEAVEVFGVSTFTGPAVYTEEEKFQKIEFVDIDEGDAKFVPRANNGWLAMVQHYFVAAWLPETGVQRENFARKINDNMYAAGVIVPVASIPPGETAIVSTRLYAGPQEQDHLDAIAEGLGLVVDYGWLTMIAAPLFWVLSWFHDLTGNWGWSIILVTILIKAVFFPLSAASYKSMAKMRVLGPRMQRIKELYGHDKPRMQQEVMQMYRTEKINPLGGCLPILVQIPVFIALYWVLLGSVEMRHAPWLGWITDLSAKDPYFVLPVLMGLSMFVQMRLNPAPPDPIQAKVMMALPFVFTIMFLWFPSGLVLYWVVNNILSIAQQWHITRNIEASKKAGKPV